MSAKTGRAPAIITASAEYAAESGGVMTSSPGPISRPRKINVMASVPVPTPTACETPLAAANSLSNASTSGPSTNHPLAITRSMAARMSPASSPGASELNGTFTDVARKMLAVIVEGARETFAQFHFGTPARTFLEHAGVGVEAADVDRLLVCGPLDERVAALPRDLDEHLHQVAMRNVLFAADVEGLAVHGICGARREKRLDGIIDVDEIA